MEKELLKIVIKNAIKEVLVENAQKVIARHKDWVAGATITESDNNGVRRFVATVEGWRDFLIYEGQPNDDVSRKVQTKVREIRDRLRAGDKSVLNENTSIV